MPPNILSIRLRIARKIMGYSLENLASLIKVHVTKQSLSRYEAGVMKPRKELLDAIADALKISSNFFYGTNIQLDKAMLRTSSNSKMSSSDIDNVEAVLSYRVERYINKAKLAKRLASFHNPLSNRLICEYSNIDHTANQLRLEWQCGDGAIPSIVRLLERKGVLIFDTKLPDEVMGLSTWADSKYPVIAIDNRREKTTIERLRFTIAHELAHLLLQFDNSLNIEKCCDKFAGSFLLPSNTLKEEIGEHRNRLYLEELIDLREAYGVSVAALVHQAFDQEIISREHYDWWFNETIKTNIREIEWGQYKFPETLSRERRIDIIINNIEDKQL